MANINEGMAKKDPSDFENILVQLRTHVKDSEGISNDLYSIAETLTSQDKEESKPEPEPSMIRGGIIPEMCYLIHQLELINAKNHGLLQRLHRMV
ncbi:MAG: hypothetical protein WC333_01950 [Dehalococcoidia bacterium]|jgi:hypothetical protein